MSATVKCWWALRRIGGAARRAATRSAAPAAAPVGTAAPALPRPRIAPRPRIRHALVLVCAGGVPGAALILPPEAPPAAPPAPLGAPAAAEGAAWRLAMIEADRTTTQPVPVPLPGAALLLLTGIAALLAARRL